MFWSSQILIEKFDTLIVNGDKSNVEDASYTLRIGPEVFITPEKEPPDTRDHHKIKLEPDESFNIPMGQFAFLLTEEEVYVPKDAIAFISFKAKYKFKGLVNVSGFHVDPGFRGQLVFALFNAGPRTVTLYRGENFFLIWYASLNQESSLLKNRPVQKNISVDLINDINGEVFSPMVLKNKISALKDEIVQIEGKKIPEIENRIKNYILGTAIAAVLVLIVGFVGRALWDFHKNNELSQIQTQVNDIIQQQVTLEIKKEIPKLMQEFLEREKSDKILTSKPQIKPLPDTKIK